MVSLPKNKQLILFDGVCNLCNGTIQFIIKHDKDQKFMFAALQSSVGQSMIKTHHIDPSKTDSILLYSQENGISIKSTAALLIAKQMKFPINIVTAFIVIPVSIRDKIYDYIAKNRFKWFGKKESCMIPTKEIQSRFL